MRERAAAGGPVGIDIGRLDALEVDLGKVEVRRGTGFRAEKVTTTGAFKTDAIVVGGGEPGKS